mgnify:CR=1 FL=1
MLPLVDWISTTATYSSDVRGFRSGLCRKEENELAKCEMEGYVPNSPRPLYERAAKCRKEEQALRECELYVLYAQPAALLLPHLSSAVFSLVLALALRACVVSLLWKTANGSSASTWSR